ncbi:MAG: ParA family protein [Alphaproteobacteria bacterium]|nr:ParA family protein [Alphaproteobacteria bacterium]
MSACILTVAQQKGGAGKSTLVAQLAVAYAHHGHRVGLIDVDPQASLTAWFEMRQKTLGQEAGGISASQVAGWKLATEIDRMKKNHDLILIDSPPHAETDARVAVRAAALVLVPVQPSPMDLWATKPTLDLVKKEKSRALLVVNRIQPQGRLPRAILAKLVEAELPLAQIMLGNRVAFAASMMEGLGVLELSPRSPSAIAEIEALSREIAKILGLKF